MSNKDNLDRAREARNDEFYTRREDVEKELQHYMQYLEGKTIYSNCDAAASAFNAFFGDLWKKGHIKRFICSGIEPDTGAVYYSDTERPFDILPSGDYAADCCTDLMKQADIVCTNPPFSVYQHYFSFLRDYKKQFLIIGSNLSFSYITMRKDFMVGSFSLGYNIVRAFRKASGALQQVNAFWLTNLPVQKYYEAVVEYEEGKYDRLQEYGIINVKTVKDLPKNYAGIMAVPATTLYYLGRQQYTICGYIHHPHINGKRIFSRYLIRWNNQN